MTKWKFNFMLLFLILVMVQSNAHTQATEVIPGVYDAKKDDDFKARQEGRTRATDKEFSELALIKESTKAKKNYILKKVNKNFASSECGAKILAFNPESTNPKAILNSDKDDYMINPCIVKKWVMIELCEPMQAQSIDIASLEPFSSKPKVIKMYLSDRYPTKSWKFAVEKTLIDERVIQSFYNCTGLPDYFAQFVKLELVDHFGDEFYCPLTIFRVYGIAVTDYVDLNQEEPGHNNIDDDHTFSDDMVEDSKNMFDIARGKTTMDEHTKAKSTDIPSSTQMQTATDNQSEDTSSVLVGTQTKTDQSSEQPSDVDNLMDKDKIVVSEATVLTSKIEVKSTTSTDIMMQTDSKDKLSSSTQSKIKSTNTRPQIADIQDTKITDSAQFNPCSTVFDSDITETCLPVTWKPDTKDVLETDTQSESETFIQADDKMSKVIEIQMIVILILVILGIFIIIRIWGRKEAFSLEDKDVIRSIVSEALHNQENMRLKCETKQNGIGRSGNDPQEISQTIETPIDKLVDVRHKKRLDEGSSFKDEMDLARDVVPALVNPAKTELLRLHEEKVAKLLRLHKEKVAEHLHLGGAKVEELLCLDGVKVEELLCLREEKIAELLHLDEQKFLIDSQLMKCPDIQAKEQSHDLIKTCQSATSNQRAKKISVTLTQAQKNNLGGESSIRGAQGVDTIGREKYESSTATTRLNVIRQQAVQPQSVEDGFKDLNASKQGTHAKKFNAS